MLAAKINYEKYQLTKKEWLLCFLEIFALTILVNYLCYRKAILLVLGVPFGYFFVRWTIRKKKQERKQRLTYHFGRMLQGLCSSIAAGSSMERAIGECKKDMAQIYGEKDELVCELRHMEWQMSLGIPDEKLFLDLGQRCGVEEVQNFAEIYLISKRHGGNLRELLNKSVKILGEKIQVEQEIQVSIAAKRMEQLVMSMIPAGMILYLQMVSDQFLDVLYQETWGMGIMSLCLGIYGFSIWMGKKIVRIEV